MIVSADRLEAAYVKARAALLAERTPQGHWVGELSSSALSTATALMALTLVQKHSAPHDRFDGLIAGGFRWLAEHQNADGGWGDTVKSFSNISTTMLCRAAYHLADRAEESVSLRRAEAWLFERYGSTPAELAEAVRKRYGVDRTFAVPILTTCALAGLVPWSEVPPLPFELACFPQSWFRFLRLHVVSYALPALIAIGQCVHQHRGTWNPFTLLLRRLARARSLKVLRAIQPSSGGYLEATPLTSFVTLSLASIGLAEHPVATDAVRFLVSSVRPDGSWAIDSNLATWVTTLSINALAAAGDLNALDRKEQVKDWLLRQQHNEWHPYTGADPGGWAWTDLPGGVPDADDTPGALLALHHLASRERQRPESEAPSQTPVADAPGSPSIAAMRWLRRLQNSDGGWPTFCRGWGHLPFDRSGADLTAHALRALAHCSQLQLETKAMGFGSHGHDALTYLSRNQRDDGSWLPLWFGNQHAHDDENPVYGTARVLAAYRDLGRMSDVPACRAVAWLLSVQNPDGGWGGALDTPSTVEETALATEVLLAAGATAQNAVNRGLLWLVQRVEDDRFREPSPIGFYFAKLWYFEKLYPVIFTVAALGCAHRQQSSPEASLRAPGGRE